jgi:hypothetical protein
VGKQRLLLCRVSRNLFLLSSRVNKSSPEASTTPISIYFSVVNVCGGGGGQQFELANKLRCLSFFSPRLIICSMSLNLFYIKRYHPFNSFYPFF